MKKVFLLLTMFLFAFTGVTRANVQQNRDDQVIEQGFEDGLGDWTTNHCHSSSGVTSSYGGNTGNYAFRFYYTTNYPQYLISPELDDNDGVNFTFYAARYSSNYPETFKVGYSSTTNEPTEFTWSSEVTCTTLYGAGAYQEYSYDFPAGTKYVSIACTSNYQFYMFVDDITVTATEPAPTPGGALTTTPDVLDLGYRPNGAWMAPYVFTINGTGTTVNALDFSGNYFTYNAELPATLTAAHPLEVELTTGEAEEGAVNSTMTVLFSGNRDAQQFNVTANAYNPVNGDVYEKATVVSSFPYNATAPASIYKNYALPTETEGADAVYKMTFANDVMLTAGTTGADGVAALYTEDFNGEGGPMEDNNYEYNGPTINPGPVSMWFSYAYTGSNTWYGTSAGGGYYFGYKISTDVIAAENLAGLTITTVEAAAREAYPYHCFIIEGGADPFEGNMIGMGTIENPTALYFFDINLSIPAYITGNADIWVIFYSDSPYAAYCGRYPVNTANGKIWTYNPNATTPQWTSNTTYTPVIYCHMLELPTGRTATMDLAKMEVKKGNGVVSEVAEAEGNVMNVAKAQIANNNSRDVIDNNIEDLYVKAGTYYLAVASTDAEFPVSIATAEVPAPEQAIVYAPMDGETNVEYPYLAEWMLGDYTEEMQVLLGTQYPPQTALIDWTDYLVESAFLPELEPNQSYFMQVNERNAAGTTMGEIIAFTTPINAVDEVIVTNPALYPGDAAMLTWTAPERSFKGYNIYQDGVKINESLVTTTEYAVEDLPYNMDGYLFQVSAVYDAGESLLSAPDTAYMTGFGSVNGYVYDTDTLHPIANATMVVVGIDEYGAIQQYEFLTDETGFYEGEVLAGLYDVGILTEGYETAATVIYVAYDQLTGVEDIITHEFYYPLGQITATEEESDVLVEWSWDPAEMIVDFETGDFSQAEFTLPAQYPWAITTTNPYEGTYCMKSTCEGVASGVSSIEATVEVPYYAKMGFWVRVSSESNYDKFHFYIDGVEQGQALSGQLAYQYKEYTVEAGVHTYKWEYAKDSSVNSNDDCVYVDDITMYMQDVPPQPIPGATVYDFDDDTMMGWTSIDADGDGNGWVSSANPGIYHNSGVNLSGTGHNASEAYVISGSYANQTGQALTPDNYLVAPTAISAQDGAAIEFYACAQDANYAAEHFGVAVSTTTASAGAFTTIQEWTLTAKSMGTVDMRSDVRGTRDQGAWYMYTVDLSAYAGQDIWVAIRHFNCTDMFILNVDDITLGDGSAKGFDRAGNRSLVSYNLYRRNNIDEASVEDPEMIAEGLDSDVMSYVDNDWTTLPYGEWQWGIQATYEGYAPEPERSRETFTYGFEGGLEGWTGIVVNTDGGEWIHSNNNLGGYDYTTLAHTGTGFAMCYSYVDYDGAYDTDAFLVSPQSYSMDASSQINFFADNANDTYPENFSVWVSTAANPTSASDFTQVWSGGAKGTGSNGAVVRKANNNRYENWREHTIDLSAYAGQEVWIAFRDVNYDQYEIWIDDVTITASSAPVPPTPGPTGNGLSEIIWSNVLDKDMISTVTLNVVLNNGQAPVGAEVELTAIDFEEEYIMDETGTVVIELRKGEYIYEVELDGYTPVDGVLEITEDVEEYTFVLDEIIAPVADFYVSPTGWAMWEGGTVGPTPGPTPGPTGVLLEDDFEDGALTNWTTVDADGDGDTWQNATPASYSIGNAHSGTNCASSWSWNSVTMYPDNWMISPMVEGATNIQYYVATNTAYPDHYGVYASSTGTNTSDFTLVFEETAGSKGGNGVKSSMTQGSSREMSAWMEKNIDLPAGTKYVAFRHWNSDDMNYLFIDDVTIEGAGRGDRAPLSYKVFLEGEFVGETVYPFFQVPVEGLTEGEEYTVAVAPLYATGMGETMYATFTYAACSNYNGATNYAAAVNGQDVTLTWTLPSGGQPGPGPQPGGDTFTEDFEGGLNGWNVLTINADGGEWIHSDDNLGGYDYTALAHSGTGFAMCYSFVDYVGSFNTDSYMYTPQMYTISNGSTLTFWADNANDSYPESFSVVISTAANPASAADFTTVWSGSAKGTASDGAMVRHNNNRYENWRSHTVDLSSYAGQTVYIGFHDVNYDMYEIWIDDVELGIANKGNRAMWDLVGTMTGTSAGQQAVATDGSFIYTASWQSAPTGGYTFYKYDLDGTFVEGFNITGATGIRDLTFDGDYFYGTSGGTQIFCLDLANKTLVGTINCSGLTSRHISYDPERDGFWSGNWSTLALYSRTGSLIQSGAAPSSAYGSAYYKDADGVEHLYLFCQPNSDCQVYDYNIATNTISSSPVLDFSSTTPGCTGIAGGCFIGNYDNKLCWFGNSQQDPNLIGIYELEGTPGPGPGPQPVPGDVLGVMIWRDGEPLTYAPLNASTFTDEAVEAGEHEYCIRVVYSDYAMACDQCETVTVGGAPSCDPVINPNGYYMNYQGQEGLVVDWTDPEGVTAIGLYEIDGGTPVFIGNAAPGQHPIFLGFEGQVPACTITLGFVAVYADCESDMVTCDIYYDAVDEQEVVNAIYPNPTSGDLHVNATAMTHVTVYNAMGQMIYDQEVSGDELILNMGQYEAGVYMVKVTTETGSSVKRINVVR